MNRRILVTATATVALSHLAPLSPADDVADAAAIATPLERLAELLRDLSGAELFSAESMLYYLRLGRDHAGVPATMSAREAQRRGILPAEDWEHVLTLGRPPYRDPEWVPPRHPLADWDRDAT